MTCIRLVTIIHVVYVLCHTQKGLNVFSSDLTNTITCIPFGISRCCYCYCYCYIYIRYSIRVCFFCLFMCSHFKRTLNIDTKYTETHTPTYKQNLSIFRSNYNIICIFRLLSFLPLCCDCEFFLSIEDIYIDFIAFVTQFYMLKKP